MGGGGKICMVLAYDKREEMVGRLSRMVGGWVEDGGRGHPVGDSLG